MEFRLIERGENILGDPFGVVFLRIDRWNDYSFVTMFDMVFYNGNGDRHEVGKVKIGFKGQTAEEPTHKKINNVFYELGDEYFSLGCSVGFYENIYSLGDEGRNILNGLNDIVNNTGIIEMVKDEEVFSTSLLRNESLSVIKGQYQRVLSGDKKLTDFKFSYVRKNPENFSNVKLDFDVFVGSKPATNIHAIIGRNGVGKTTLLNDMISSVSNSSDSVGRFIERCKSGERDINEEYFSNLVSVSFSAFDPFVPPREQSDPAKGTCYYYIGLKDGRNDRSHRDIDSLQGDCCKALTNCFNDRHKDELWCDAIRCLGYDGNLSSVNLMDLRERFFAVKEEAEDQAVLDAFRESYPNIIKPILNNLSSGHAIVLLTITRLVAKVQEKTLVLIDEPESHLHPPLLAAFIRALSKILLAINGVSIIATHSPVVLQEIPKTCVWKVYRNGNHTIVDRPKIETFAENLDVLTSDVFGLEVELSGFHNMLKESVETGKKYKEILENYDNQIGYEGRAILKALIASRDSGCSND